MEKLFSSTNNFRLKAGQSDIDALYNYYAETKSEDWNKDDCPYGFSRSSATNLLREYHRLKNNVDALPIRFEKLNVKPHTIYVTDDIWASLNDVYTGYEGVDKKNVLDALLRKVLDFKNI